MSTTELGIGASLPHDNQVGMVLGVEITLLFLMLTVVTLRFYARTVIKKTLGPDDWVMGAAAFFAASGGIIHIVSTQFGTGRHRWVISHFFSSCELI